MSVFLFAIRCPAVCVSLGDENKLSLLGLGALEPLIRLISHSSRAVRRGAVVALGSMAVHGQSLPSLQHSYSLPSKSVFRFRIHRFTVLVYRITENGASSVGLKVK